MVSNVLPVAWIEISCKLLFITQYKKKQNDCVRYYPVVVHRVGSDFGPSPCVAKTFCWFPAHMNGIKKSDRSRRLSKSS